MKASVIILAGVAGVAAITAPIACPFTPRLLWNASASAPIGLYRVRPIDKARRGMMVAIWPPIEIARFAAGRHYLPIHLPLIKWIAGTDGDRVCRSGVTIRVNDRVLGQARLVDRLGRPLPRWRGCIAMRPGNVFVMNPAASDSFDGRYFGALPAFAIIGAVSPLWTRASSPTAHFFPKQGAER